MFEKKNIHEGWSNLLMLSATEKGNKKKQKEHVNLNAIA